jgi:hypothetical protein
VALPNEQILEEEYSESHDELTPAIAATTASQWNALKSSAVEVSADTLSIADYTAL